MSQKSFSNKKKRQKIAEIKCKLQKRLSQKRSSRTLVEPPTSPRYDTVFYKGTEWLNSL